ncbi:hypothetical protein [Streptomyces sp. NBC_00212]|uniref:hypothetical protein n=1 Tax=Streptomyces sp. NBC_00212 TaxID=2975684 RepID=UPI00324E353A
MSQLRLLLAEEGADAERLDALTGFLREELLRCDVEDVLALRSGSAPPGARSLDMAVIGGLLVSLGHTTDGLATVVAAVRSWLNRTGGTRRAVRLELDGDVLEIADATTTEQDRLVDLFIGRHISGANRP